MLNDLIRNANILTQSLERERSAYSDEVLLFSSDEKLRRLAEECERAVEEALNFVSANHVPVDTVISIEDRILRDLKKAELEEQIRADYAQAKTELEKAKKDTEWLKRSAESGRGAAESRYYEMRAKMDDFREESARMTREQRIANIDTFAALDGEYLRAKAEYERVGSSDRNELMSDLAEAEARLASAETKFDERRRKMNGLPLSASDVGVVSGSGCIARALRDGCADTGSAAGEARFAGGAVPGEEEIMESEIVSDPSLSAAKEEVGAPLPEAEEDRLPPAVGELRDEQAARAVSAALKDDERFRFVMDEVRFQASLEVAKLRNELEEVRRKALDEADALKEEIERLRQDAAFLREEAENARSAVTTIQKARKAATASAKRTIAVARKTSSLAKTVASGVPDGEQND